MTHDEAEAAAKAIAKAKFDGLTDEQLKLQLKAARERYRRSGPTHQNAMDCEEIGSEMMRRGLPL